MDFKIGDLVTRESYNNDVVFKIHNIQGTNAILKGVVMRLIADSPISDLKRFDKSIEDVMDEQLNSNEVKSRILKRHK